VTRSLNRSILALAIPAFGSLIVEPLFLAVDTAMVGHLGVTQLAGIGIASSILQTLVGLMVFLAYSTTPAVARLFGSGNTPGAISRGIDGMWLALGIGAALSVVGYLLSPWAITMFRPSGGVCPPCSSCSRRRDCCAACRTPSRPCGSPASASPPTPC
jgi:Na+-driven multidrug efflux pump